MEEGRELAEAESEWRPAVEEVAAEVVAEVDRAPAVEVPAQWVRERKPQLPTRPLPTERRPWPREVRPGVNTEA